MHIAFIIMSLYKTIIFTARFQHFYYDAEVLESADTSRVFVYWDSY